MTTVLPVSRRLAFSEIPVIDMSPVVNGKNQVGIVDAIENACTEVGFFYICNHGVARGLVKILHDQAKRYFAQSMDVKRKHLVNKSMRVYLPLYYRSYEGENRAGISHQQGFWIGSEQDPDPARPLQDSNRWPEYPPDLKQVMLDYFQAMESLSAALQEIFAQALGLAPDFFEPLFDNPTSRLKLNHYPPQNNPQAENNIGVVPHSDSGAFTILWQDDSGGLEIQNKTGDWVGAPPIDDTFIVNIGNIMQMWSNGRFSSTPHRVINRSGADRYSIPFFVNPNPDVVVKPLTGDPNLFEPFVYGQYQAELWERTFPIIGETH